MAQELAEARAMASECRVDWRHLWLIVAVAFAVRLAMLLWTHSGWYVVENPMAKEYLERGFRIADGRGYVHEDGEPAMLHPPGLSLLAAGFRTVLNCGADVPVQVTGAMLDALATGVVTWIAWTIFDSRVGIVAGLLYASALPAAFVCVTKVPDGMMALFVAGASAATSVAIRQSGLVRWGALAATGLLLGLASYLRPDYALLPLAMLPVLWVIWRRLFPAIKAVAIVQAMVLLVLLPWAWRNHQVSGRWIFTSTNVGPALITGLGEFQNPWHFGPSDNDREREARAAGFTSPWTAEADEHFRSVFWRSVTQKPLGYALAVTRRVPLALATPLTWGLRNPYRTVGLAQLQSEGMDRYQVVRSRLGYVVAAYWDFLLSAAISLACLICAIVMLWRERDRRALILLLLLPHIYAVGSHLLTHMEPRFLLPSYYCLVIAAAYVLTKAWKRPAQVVEACA